MQIKTRNINTQNALHFKTIAALDITVQNKHNEITFINNSYTKINTSAYCIKQNWKADAKAMNQ